MTDHPNSPLSIEEASRRVIQRHIDNGNHEWAIRLTLTALELGHITEEEAAAIRQACGWVVQRRLGI